VKISGLKLGKALGSLNFMLHGTSTCSNVQTAKEQFFEGVGIASA
jgi:hypothetical protein